MDQNLISAPDPSNEWLAGSPSRSFDLSARMEAVRQIISRQSRARLHMLIGLLLVAPTVFPAISYLGRIVR